MRHMVKNFKHKLLILPILCLGIVQTIFGTINIAYAAGVDVATDTELRAVFDSGGEATMVNDITLSANTAVNQDSILDLNGHTLTLSGSTLVTYANLTVKDSSSAQTGKIYGTSSFVIQIGSNSADGSLVLESGTISGKTYGVRNFGTLTINGGTITAPRFTVYNQGETILNNGAVLATSGISFQNYTNANLEMNGGTIKTDADYQALNLYGNCTATINDGQILAPKEGTTYSGNGITLFKDTVLTVNGGTISSYGNAILGNGSESGSSEGTNAKITVNGGTITSEVGAGLYIPQISGQTTITGGNISGRTGIEIRAGELLVTGGSITGEGPYETTPNTNGLTTKGTAISVAQHTTLQPINVTISGGDLTGYMPLSFTNPLDNDEEDLQKISINIIAGTFTGEDFSDVIEFSPSDFISYDENGNIIVKDPTAQEDDDSTEILVPNTNANHNTKIPDTGVMTSSPNEHAILNGLAHAFAGAIIAALISFFYLRKRQLTEE